MKRRLVDAASELEQVESCFKQWREAAGRDAVERKLILPKLELGLRAEVQKFRECQAMVAELEQGGQQGTPWHIDGPAVDAAPSDSKAFLSRTSNQKISAIMKPITTSSFESSSSSSSSLATASRRCRRSPSSASGSPASSSDGFSDLLLHSQGVDSRGSAEWSRLFQLSSVSTRFYEEVDDLHKAVKSDSSSLATTAAGSSAGGSQTPRSSPGMVCSNPAINHSCSSNINEGAPAEDDFLRDDEFLESFASRQTRISEPGDEEADEELSSLLSRGSAMSAAYLEGWQLDRDANDDLGAYVCKEKLHGIQRIKSQLGQAAHLFKELAQLINEQKDDLDVLGAKMGTAKGGTSKTVEELRKANALKQRARRRNFFCVLLTVLVVGVIVLIYVVPNSTGSAGPSAESVASMAKDIQQAVLTRFRCPGPAPRLMSRSRLLFPGVAPYLQSKAVALPLPQKVRRFLVHPAGPFTIHFWAPTFKWAITVANLADLSRPPDKLSLEQQLAITATGLIWSRYAMVVRPRNYNLLSVNMFMAATGVYQLSRIFRDRQQAQQLKCDKTRH